MLALEAANVKERKKTERGGLFAGGEKSLRNPWQVIAFALCSQKSE